MRKAIVLFVIAILLISSFPSIILAAPPDSPTHDADFSSEQILVKFKPDVALPEAAQIHRQLGGQAKGVIPGVGVQVIKVPRGKVKDKVKAYSSNPRVAYAEPDFLAQALGSPDDPYFNKQYGLTKVEAPEAWEVTAGSPSINIAILDTGVDLDHPDLAGKIVSNINFSSGTTVDDVHGHGTHVAGIAAAMTNNGAGVAGLGYSCSIMNVKVMGDNGGGTYSAIASGIIWAADNGAEVINMSLGGSGYSSTLEDAVNYAWSKGVVVVAAAGNNGDTSPIYPAYCINCMAVAATDAIDERTSWSNYGDWVDVAAPGNCIYATLKDNSYGYKSGTSMASPHVAGLAGLVFTTLTDVNGNGYLNDEVRSRIESTCDDIGVEGIGSGRINAAQAVQGDDIVQQADVQMTLTADPASISEAGTVVTYTYTVTNTGDVTLTGITLADDKLGSISLGAATLAAGAATTGTATYTVTQSDMDSGADIVNTATVTTDQGATASDSATVTIEISEITGVAITPTDSSGSGRAGEDVLYVFTVQNTGNVPDTYSVSVTSGWTSHVTPQTLALEPTASATITVTHTVPEVVSPGDFDSGAVQVLSSETGASTIASFTTTARVSAVEITPGQQTGTAAPGQTVQYSYTITNTGNEDDVYTLQISADWDASLGTLSLSLQEGGSAQVLVSHTIPMETTGDTSDKGILVASSESASAEATFTTTAQVEEEPVAPVIDVFTVCDKSNPAWAWVTAGWAVSDDDGNLVSVEILMVLDGEVVDSAVFSLSGYYANGTCELRNRNARGKTYEVTLIVTDADGNTTPKTESIRL
ncbi:MAG: S8 family serine peptidase [Dehalococcoidia bacterium]